MPWLPKCVGLEFLEEEEEVREIAQNTVEVGKHIEGYGRIVYSDMHLGSIQIETASIDDENNKTTILSADIHADSKAVWTGKVIDDMSEDVEHIYPVRQILMNNLNGEGTCIVNLINSEVLPSFLENDEIKFQVVGCAVTTVDYYKDEQEYMDECSSEIDGGNYSYAQGVFPVGLLHSTGNTDENKVSSDVTLIVGEVDCFEKGLMQDNNDKAETYLLCNAKTPWGNIAIIHTMDQLNMKHKNNLRKGAVICVGVILSGDVAIYEYENGVIHDTEHNLMALRYSMLSGQTERLVSIIAEDAVYESVYMEETISSRKNIINRLSYVADKRNGKFYIRKAVISGIKEDGNSCNYPVGTKCMILSYNEPDDFDSILFIDEDENHLITHISITNDSNYEFSMDTSDVI